jgi:hypothetical protein
MGLTCSFLFVLLPVLHRYNDTLASSVWRALKLLHRPRTIAVTLSCEGAAAADRRFLCPVGAQNQSERADTRPNTQEWS